MSAQELHRFQQRLAHDATFALAYQRALVDSAGNATPLASWRFAKQQGFQIPRADFMQWQQQIAPQIPTATASLKLSRLEQGFLWLSGASPHLLASCPESEQKKHAALGATVLIPALFSTVTSSFLLSSLQDFSALIITGVAILWMIIVLLMDRALLATYRKSFSWWTSLRQFGLRFLIALLIAFTVAHPVILLLFSGTINEEYDKSKAAKHTQLSKQYDLQNNALTTQINEQQLLLKNNSHFEPPVCVNANNAGLAANEELNQLENKKSQALENIKLFRKNAEDERNGITKEGLTGHKGCKQGSECRAWIRKAGEAQDIANVLERDINKLKAIINDQVALQQKILATQCATERQSWAKQRVAQNELAQKKLAQLLEQSQQLQQQYLRNNEQINALKPDILKQTKILHSLMGFNTIESLSNLLLFLAFMLLFLLIDMLAVLLKLTSSGLYETKVDIEEYHHRLHYFIFQRQRGVMQSSQLINAERQLIAQVGEQTFKNQLTQSLELLIELLINADNLRQQQFFKTDFKKNAPKRY